MPVRRLAAEVPEGAIARRDERDADLLRRRFAMVRIPVLYLAPQIQVSEIVVARVGPVAG